MKHSRTTTLLAIAAALALLSTAALADIYYQTIDGICWTYTVSENTASVGGGWDHWDCCYSPAVSTDTSGAIVIPSALGGYPVTSIGDGAFYGCSGLTNVTIPNSVTSIGGRAFYGCSGLTSVTIPDSVTSIGGRAFYGCSGLTSVTIPYSVTSIGEDAFCGCSCLEAFSVAEENPAYKSASGLLLTKDGTLLVAGVNGKVVIPDSVSSIGDDAFSGCSGLTSMTIPYSVTSIGSSAFSDCSGLTSVTIPDSVTSIGWYVFYGCNGLTSVTIPQSVCSRRLSDIFPTITDVVISDNVTSIGDDAFSGCSGLTSVRIGNGVTTIGNNAFTGCYNLKTMEIPDSVTSIGYAAFENCRGLVSCTIGKGVASIAAGTANAAQDECHATFANAYTLTSFSVDSGNPAYKSVQGVIYTKDGKELVAFPAGCRGEFAIPNGVEKIWAGAFCGAFDLELLIVPDSVTEIGDGVFAGCSSLTNVCLPARLKEYKEKKAYFAVSKASSCAHCTLTYSRPIERDLSLDGQGGVVETVTIHPTYCEAMPAVAVPTREGYRFCGYFSEPNGGGVQYYTADGKSCRTWDSLSVTTLYAKWKEKTVVTVAVPVITPGDGAIFGGESCEVSISCATAGAAIYFSTNGTTPRLTDAFRYTGPFSITDSAVIKTVAVLDDVKSEYATASIRKMSLTLAEAAGAPALPFATGGAANWTPIGDPTSVSGFADQCGAIGPGSETWMENTVSGAGTFAFSWKVDCERDDSGAATWDHLAVAVDGVEAARIDGRTGWATVSLALEGPGTHSVRWTFVKDDYDEGTGFRDLAWVSGVEWMPEGGQTAMLELGRIFTAATANGNELAVTADVAWTAESDAPWLTFQTASGNGNGVVVYDLAANTGTEARTGIITVTGGGLVRIFGIMQRGKAETQGSPVGVPFQWLEKNASGILAANGGNYEAAAMAQATNGLPVWKCYVAGLSTTDEEAEFKVKSISFVNGEPVLEWNPDLNENGTKTNRAYRVEGKPALTNEWSPAAPDSRFFRVWVGMPE